MSNAKWDYTVTQVQFQTPPLDLTKPKSLEAIDSMRKMGDDGWELVNMIQQNALFTMFWKREKKKGGENWTS
ncbi:MAG: hypothetical protein U0457_03150 [Candidatus Sericytochromatia bacterium]